MSTVETLYNQYLTLKHNFVEAEKKLEKFYEVELKDRDEKWYFWVETYNDISRINRIAGIEVYYQYLQEWIWSCKIVNFCLTGK